ncbi:MAG: pyridoxal-phosphate dependent enzyme [Bacteroidales bacterium]
MSLPLMPSRESILSAADRIKPYIHRTPVFESAFFNDTAGAQLFFKCENFQKAGAFKSRGAVNAVFSLSKDDLEKGVSTHSSGNHAQALARAANIAGTKAYIVMPQNAPEVKVAAVKQYGGEVIFCEPTLQSRETTLQSVIERTGSVMVHPYNDMQVITGQATACMELLEQVPGLDLVFCPVGGGGLLSGTASSIHYFSPKTRLIACEPAGADDAMRSFKAGHIVPSVQPKTIADGLLTSLGSLTFPIISHFVEDILTVEDQDIIHAMKLVWERMKIVIEPSSAVPVAVALTNSALIKGLRVGIIISGGNVDLNQLPWMRKQ